MSQAAASHEQALLAAGLSTGFRAELDASANALDTALESRVTQVNRAKAATEALKVADTSARQAINVRSGQVVRLVADNTALLSQRPRRSLRRR